LVTGPSGSMRGWRNGRRAGFRCQCPQGRGGSNPPSRTQTWEISQIEKKGWNLRVSALFQLRRKRPRAHGPGRSWRRTGLHEPFVRTDTAGPSERVAARVVAGTCSAEPPSRRAAEPPSRRNVARCRCPAPAIRSQRRDDCPDGLDDRQNPPAFLVRRGGVEHEIAIHVVLEPNHADAALGR
jgi:hypothetical protein